jgi:hypothetical protein
MSSQALVIAVFIFWPVKEVQKVFITDYRMLAHRPKRTDDECPAHIKKIIEKLEQSGLFGKVIISLLPNNHYYTCL